MSTDPMINFLFIRKVMDDLKGLRFPKFKRWKWLNEIISIPLGLIAFYFYPHIALLLEDNPAVWGVGTLQKIVFAFALVAIANGIGWLSIKLILRNVFHFKDNEFEFAFGLITPFQKCLLLLLWFAVFFYGIILAATAL